MSRIIAIGLTAVGLVACQPADQTTSPEPVTPPAMGPAAAPLEPPTAAPVLSWEATQERYRKVEVAPSDPLEALEWRAVTCDHYSGEFGGDGSERDQWLNARMDTLRCGDELMAEARAMRTARASEPDVVARLDAVIAGDGQ